MATDPVAQMPSAEQIFAGLPDALLLIDQDHKVRAMNPAAENFVGTSAKHVVNQPVDSVFHFQDSRLQSALRSGESNLVARRTDIVTKDQRSQLVDLRIQVLPNEPDWRVMAISPLPTDGPSMDREELDPGDFSIRAPDILGHEIKNPLAAIKGAAQLLNRSLGEDQKPLTQMIQSEVERIAKLMDQMQSLSANQPAKVEPTNVHALIDAARQSIEAATRGHLRIEDDFDPSIPEVLANPDALMQILSNLLSNAVDATRNTENPTIAVITRYSFGASFSAPDGNLAVRLPIEIIVRDNGPGVPPDLERDIFAPFVSTKSHGQGLGLALVRKLITDMNGRVRYERIAKTGHSQFILFLPVADRRQS